MFIEEIPTETALDFVNALSPISSRWHRAPWVFRGHGESRYQLKPMLERSREGSFAWEPYLLGPVRARLKKAHTGAYVPYADIAETWLTIEFARIADRSGLPLPGSTTFLRDAVQFIGMDTEAHARMQDPSPSGLHERLPFIAQAQHYGLPTRLLDWSRNSLAAAYFAVNGKLSATTGEVCVWCFNPDVLYQCEEVQLLSLPSMSNPNMLSQAGVFTRVNSSLMLNADDPSLENLDVAVKPIWRGKKWSKPAFVKVTMPACLAAEAWSYLKCHESAPPSYFLATPELHNEFESAAK